MDIVSQHAPAGLMVVIRTSIALALLLPSVWRDASAQDTGLVGSGKYADAGGFFTLRELIPKYILPALIP